MKNRLPALLLALALAISATACSSGIPAPAASAAEPAGRMPEPAPAPEPVEEPEIAPEPEPEPEPEEPEPVFFPDVPEGAWYYDDVRALFDLGALPEGEAFNPGERCTRLEFVRYLYGVGTALGGGIEDDPGAVYSDVPAGTPGCDAAAWASKMGVANGVSADRFNPDGSLTREQCCAMLCRFANNCGVVLAAREKIPAMFKDSLKVQPYARSYVAACQMAGLLSGYDDGTCRPAGEITHAEAARLACSLWRAAEGGVPAGMASVTTTESAYLGYYEELEKNQFGVPVPESDPVDLAWFDDAAIVGDSVTVALQMYCAGTKALGNATFLSAGSLSAINNNNLAVGPKSVHPSYNGVKMKIEDGVAACGAKNVFIMLGMNNLYVGVEGACGDMRRLIDNIKAKSPEVNIIIESVTPVARGGSVLSQGLTNEKIDSYNEAMRALCAEQGWYYLDVASRFKDEEGWLKRDYCGDLPGMGIHFTFAGTKVWTEYLITHIPDALK